MYTHNKKMKLTGDLEIRASSLKCFQMTGKTGSCTLKYTGHMFTVNTKLKLCDYLILVSGHFCTNSILYVLLIM